MYNSNFDICIAGAFAAVTVDFLVYPFDTIKTRVQSPNYEKLYKDPRTGAIRRNVLFRGLYQGVWSVVLSTIPSSGAFFTTYEAVKSSFSNSAQKPECNRFPITNSLPTPLAHALASSTAEAVACLMTTPAEVLKQNAQVVDSSKEEEKGGGEGKGKKSRGSSSSGGGSQATRQVLARFKSQPWKLWSGYLALVGRNLPFTGLQFPIFEVVRGYVVEWREKKKRNRGAAQRWNAVVERAGLTGMSASVSGTIAAIVTTPVDVIKTRLMLSAGDGSATAQDGKSKGKKRPGTLAVGKQIFREEGARGLFRGGAIRAGWTAVSLSLYLSLYEGSRFYLENRRKERDGLNDVEDTT